MGGSKIGAGTDLGCRVCSAGREGGAQARRAPSRQHQTKPSAAGSPPPRHRRALHQAEAGRRRRRLGPLLLLLRAPGGARGRRQAEAEADVQGGRLGGRGRGGLLRCYLLVWEGRRGQRRRADVRHARPDAWAAAQGQLGEGCLGLRRAGRAGGVGGAFAGAAGRQPGGGRAGWGEGTGRVSEADGGSGGLQSCRRRQATATDWSRVHQAMARQRRVPHIRC